MKAVRLSHIIAGLLVILAVAPAFAQGNAGSVNLQMTFTAPNTFYAQNTKLPAGAYAVTQLGVGQPNVLVLRSVKPGHEVLIEVAQLPSPNDKPKSSQVIFNKYGNNDFLSEIWFVGGGVASGYQVQQTAGEKSQSGSATKHSVASK